MRRRIVALGFVAGLVISTSAALGTDRLVPSVYPTIQAGIDAAGPGDTVIIAEGVYTGEGNRDIDFNGLAITVRGTDPNDANVVAATIVDCNGSELEPHRGFYFHNQEDSNSVLTGLTITNGYGLEEQLWEPMPLPVGGGIFCKNSSPKIANCIIEDNSAVYGGAIFCDGSSMILINCTISSSWAGLGGGMYNYQSNGVKVTNCTFTNNVSHIYGGGMVNMQSNTVVSRCVFVSNCGGAAGGGVRNLDCSPTFTNCRFVDNSAPVLWITGGGGGGVNNNGGSPVLTNCIFSGNRGGGGDAMSNEASQPTLTNCTFTGNRGFAAIVNWWEDTNLTLTNCILCDHTDNEIWNIHDPSVTVTYTNVKGSWPGPGNIDSDPCFVEAGKWVDANDPNIVVEPNDPNAVWVDGDYHLKSEGWRWDVIPDPPRWGYDYVTSRCIDAGNPGSPLRDELMSVPDDPCNIWGENIRINMGAYGGTAEASMPPYDWALLSDITNDGTVDFVDFAHLADIYLEEDEQLPADFDRDGDVDYADLSLLVDDWLKKTSWHE